MNEYSEQKIKELQAVPLTKSKEWRARRKLNGRKVYWTWKQKIFTIKHICPMTARIWFVESINGWANGTNAISEMYLIPKLI